MFCFEDNICTPAEEACEVWRMFPETPGGLPLPNHSQTAWRLGLHRHGVAGVLGGVLDP